MELPAGKNSDRAASHSQVGGNWLAKHSHGGARGGATCQEETGSKISQMQQYNNKVLKSQSM